VLQKLKEMMDSKFGMNIYTKATIQKMFAGTKKNRPTTNIFFGVLAYIIIIPQVDTHFSARIAKTQDML